MAKIKSLQHAPKVSDAEVQLALNKIYNEINTLIDGVNSNVTDLEKEGSGKPGDIRVTNKSNRRVALEVRTDEGWFESQVFTSEPNITLLRDLTGGASTDNTIEAVTDVATAANGIKELAVKLNEVIAILNDMNPNAFKMIQKRG
jgi:hypothetical protein